MKMTDTRKQIKKYLNHHGKSNENLAKAFILSIKIFNGHLRNLQEENT